MSADFVHITVNGTESRCDRSTVHNLITQAKRACRALVHVVIHRLVCSILRSLSRWWRKETTMTLTTIAETYLRMIPTATGHRHVGMYVRLAYKYGVPYGRIVALTRLSPEVISAHLEAD